MTVVQFAADDLDLPKDAAGLFFAANLGPIELDVWRTFGRGPGDRYLSIRLSLSAWNFGRLAAFISR
jgi:hypothetical protein